MANILPVSDLRNYNEVLKNCRKGEPVYLTKNGRGRFVVMDIEDYERERAEKKLLMKLHEAEEAVKDGEGWLDLEELKKILQFLILVIRRLENLAIPIMLHPNQKHHVIYKNLMRLWLKLQAAERILKLSSHTWIIFQEMVRFS